MTDETQEKAAKLDLARTNPAALYDAEYYESGYDKNDPEAYGRHEPWLSFFKSGARVIDRTFRPKTVIDIGCAYGLLVEALCDRKIDAYGLDVSPYAIENARADMTDRLFVHSITDPVPLHKNKKGVEAKYDMAVCIEMLEHLPEDITDLAIDNICATSDRILFSSSPDDFEEPTHFNVLPTDIWLEKFKARGFAPSPVMPVAEFIAPQARIVERPGTPIGTRGLSLKGLFGGR